MTKRGPEARPSPEPLAIIAGSGSVPLHVAAVAKAQGRDVLILGISGEADARIAGYKHAWFSWGELGRVERLLTEHKARDVVLIGGVHARPDLRTMKVDLGVLKELPNLLSLLAKGDANLLSGVVTAFERRGFHVIGAHEVAGDLVAGEGALGRVQPGRTFARDIASAMGAAHAIGIIDAGQAAVAIEGRVVALEGVEGTDAMLKRVAALREEGRLKWKGRAGVLAKCAKPQQDLRVDMPTIGPLTVAAVDAAGLAGIAVEPGRVMIVEREETVARADAAGIFILGANGRAG